MILRDWLKSEGYKISTSGNFIKDNVHWSKDEICNKYKKWLKLIIK